MSRINLTLNETVEKLNKKILSQIIIDGQNLTKLMKY